MTTESDMNSVIDLMDTIRDLPMATPADRTRAGFLSRRLRDRRDGVKPRDPLDDVFGNLFGAAWR